MNKQFFGKWISTHLQLPGLPLSLSTLLCPAQREVSLQHATIIKKPSDVLHAEGRVKGY